MNKEEQIARAARIFDILSKEYEDACCTLKLINPRQFLFANILSPQTTDKVVNEISVKLCDEFKTTKKIAAAEVVDIEKIIKPAGFYHVKAKHIKQSAKLLINKFDGKLPSNLNELQEFSGIGRKTALVILSEVFDKIEGIVIDTHNIRIANRLKLVNTDNPDKIEKKLISLIPKSNWRQWSHLMVFHGRDICRSRNPLCGECPIFDLCPSGKKFLF
jgi:endonuclease-3